MSEKSTGQGFENDPLNEIFSGPADKRDLVEMVARDGKPLITRFTVFLGVVALVLGGVIVGAHFKTSGTSTNAAAANFESLRSAFASQGLPSAGGSSALGSGGFTGFGAPTAAGQIKLIDGTNIYVTTDTGSIVKVSTDATTRIRESATLAISQLKVGDTVTVNGQDGADGTVSATSINVEAAQSGATSPTAAPTQKSSSGSTAPKSASPTPTKSGTPSGTSAPTTGGFAELTACLTKAGIKIDPTQGIRGLRDSTDPKVQAALAACRPTP
ncbi:hypothetical protein GALL_394700 [mine drainage metagenome]|uniref:Uncharacterized protein n=1 Tax=mine drainage metagenome TaxID=410659 RepID=A0A1J5QFP1_9ZZZZ